MKKKNLKGKLSLNKETMAELNNAQMIFINGGQPIGSMTVVCPKTIGCSTLSDGDTCIIGEQAPAMA